MQDCPAGVETGVDAGNDDVGRSTERAEPGGERAEPRRSGDRPGRSVAVGNGDPPHIDVGVGVKEADGRAAPAGIGCRRRDDEVVAGRENPPGEDVQALGLDAIVVRRQDPHSGEGIGRHDRRGPEPST